MVRKRKALFHSIIKSCCARPCLNFCVLKYEKRFKMLPEKKGDDDESVMHPCTIHQSKNNALPVTIIGSCPPCRRARMEHIAKATDKAWQGPSIWKRRFAQVHSESRRL
jgi:hypothetical protein